MRMTPTFIRVWGILGEGTYLRHPRQGLTHTHLLQKWPVPFLLALVKYPAFGFCLVPWLWVCMSVQLRWSWSPWPSGLAPIPKGVRLHLSSQKTQVRGKSLQAWPRSSEQVTSAPQVSVPWGARSSMSSVTVTWVSFQDSLLGWLKSSSFCWVWIFPPSGTTVPSLSSDGMSEGRGRICRLLLWLYSRKNITNNSDMRMEYIVPNLRKL